MTTQRSYWLHIVESKSPDRSIPSTYILAKADAPDRNFAGGAMPTVHYPSWETLAKKLAGVHVDNDELKKCKTSLDAKGSYTITEVTLEDKQVADLGFTPA